MTMASTNLYEFIKQTIISNGEECALKSTNSEVGKYLLII